MNRWQRRRREIDRPKASDAPPGYVYGYRRDGSLVRIKDIEDWYGAIMRQFDEMPRVERDRLNYEGERTRPWT